MKESAVAFQKLVVEGNIREAYERYVSPDMRHHNAYFPADAKSLEQGMEENHERFPRKTIDVKHVIEEGNLVAVHSHVRLQPGDPGLALFHLFRFEQGKIVEMWDVGQPIPKDSPNSMF